MDNLYIITGEKDGVVSVIYEIGDQIYSFQSGSRIVHSKKTTRQHLVGEVVQYAIDSDFEDIRIERV